MFHSKAQYPSPDEKSASLPRRMGGMSLVGISMLFLTGLHGVAQMAVRPSLSGAQASIDRMAAITEEPYNLKLGQVRFRLSANARAEYNDNINLAETGAESDLILGTTLTAQGTWHVTPLNSLRLTLGVGYEKYLAHPEFDSRQLQISPGSQLSFDVFVAGRVKLTFYDRFSVIQDPIQEATLSNTVNFGRFENALGVTALWDMNAVILVLGYEHSNYLALQKSFSYLDRNGDTFRISPGFPISADTTVGLDSAVTYTYYNQKVQNDSTSFNLGPYVETSLSNYLKLRASGGFQGMEFATGGSIGDSSSLNSWYADLALAHRVNRFWTETLSVGREGGLALQSNFQEITYVRYTTSPQIFQKLSTDLNLFYEHVAESGTVDAEKVDRYGGGIQLGYDLTKKLHIGGGYQIVIKNSDLPGSNYLQNRVFLNVGYQF